MNWIDRKFEFDFPATIYPELIQRLKSTPLRLEGMISELPPEILTIRQSNKWSIQENAGHLITVDRLFAGRLDDYVNNTAELRPAKLDGSRTDMEDYNSHTIEEILTDFRENRGAYINRLADLEAGFFEKQSWHPRLKQPMRVCDMLYFQAEHDDYHLNKITKIKNILTQSL
jgi:uncharacterized damage-inducible protein DinB